jgi:prophage antirepressor-like protein
MLEEIVAVSAAEKSHGTAADVAQTLGLGLDGEAVQDDLDDLVARSL